jgi:hypothetical protein
MNKNITKLDTKTAGLKYQSAHVELHYINRSG